MPNNTLLNNQEITKEIRKEIKICLKTNDNETVTTQSLWDAVKAVQRGKFTAMWVYLKKHRHQTHNLNLHLKQLEKEQQQPKKPKVSRKKEIIKIRAEISEKEMKDYSKAGSLRR